VKILLLCWHFPPNNTIAAIRIGKLARYLHQNGHDVRVLTSRESAKDVSLPVEIPDSLIVRTDWMDVDKIAHPIANRKAPAKRSGASAPPSQSGRISELGRLKASLSNHYNALFFFPDRQVGWIPYVLSAARRLFQQWRPDIVFASGPPFSGHVAAALINKFWGVPWIAEFRDRWSDDPYQGARYRSHFTRLLEKRLEKLCIRTASGILTVSEPWAKMYASAFPLPTAVVYNGFDPADFPEPQQPIPTLSAPLTICHMGTVYAGRDPTPLFRALDQSGLAPEDVQVRFYGAEAENVIPLADQLGVAPYVAVMGRAPYAESLRIQRESDILLLLQWNSPDEFGNVPAKLFEYFAAQRPILAIGLEDGVPANLIRAKAAGLFSNDAAEIANALRGWSSEKRSHGFVPLLPSSVRQGFARDEQYAHFESFACDLVKRERRASAVQASLSPVEKDEAADLGALQGPTLGVVIDAEEEFDWRAPFSRETYSIEWVKQQPLLQRIFDRAGVTPTYVVDYPVAKDEGAVQLLRGLVEQGKCVVGAQLHPWVNPPFEEELNLRNSYLNNLDPAIQRRKLEALTELLTKQFHVAPRIFKAGRYGFDRTMIPLLREFGYRVDTSVVPHTSFEDQEGPSYMNFPDQPFWLGSGRELLELPLSCGFAGRFSGDERGVFQALNSERFRRLHIPGLLARTGLLERIRLSPEGIDLPAQKRLTRALLGRGHKVFVLSFHTSSLAPGGTPYVRTRADLDVLLQRIEGYLSYFLEEVGGTIMSVPEIMHAIMRKVPARDSSDRQLAS
jgi:glycosyltransferase involved in cell wall biosynthesis